MKEAEKDLPDSKNRSLSKINNLAHVDIIFILGCPGAGKGTLCKILAVKINAFHLSVGDYHRELSGDPPTNDDPAARGGWSLEELRSSMAKRDLAPAPVIGSILKYKLHDLVSKGWTKVILDGFPRTVESAEAFEYEVGIPSMVIYFHCPRDVAEKRFLERKRSNDDDQSMYAKRYADFEEFNPKLVQRYGDVLKMVDSSGEIEVSRKSMFEKLGILDQH